MLLGSDDGAGLLGAAHDKLTVDGLNGIHIDYTDGNALFRQHLGSLYRLVHQKAAGDDGDIAALTDDCALAELELLILGVQIGIDITGQAQVHRAVGLGGVPGRPAGGGRIGGNDDLHVRKRPHDCDILGSVVAGAVECVAHAAVCAAELDIQVRIAYLVTGRQQTQRGEENGEGVYKGYLADGGHTRSGCDHVLLGDAHVEEALGMRLAEKRTLGRAGKVGIENNYIFVSVAQLGQNRAVDLSYLLRHLLHLRVPPWPLQSFRRLSPCRAMCFCPP